MAATIHIDLTTRAQFHEAAPMPEQEIAKGLKASAELCSLILRYFDAHPGVTLGPAEFKRLLNLPNPIHGIRPRFTELMQCGMLERTDERIPTGAGGKEYRFRRRYGLTGDTLAAVATSRPETPPIHPPLEHRTAPPGFRTARWIGDRPSAPNPQLAFDLPF